MNLATGVPASGVRDTRSLHEHNNAIKLRRNTSRWWPHPRVRTSPEVGPGATVGTPGLGYPLLLCLGKDLVVILNYIRTAGPLRSGILFPQQRPGPILSWDGSGDTTCPGKGRNPCASSRGSGPPRGDRTPAGSRTPHGVPNHLCSDRTPL